MNQKSTNCHDDNCKKKEYYYPTILKCNCSGGSTSVPAITPTPPLVLTKVKVNIPKWRNTCVKIEYTSTIGFVSGPGGATVDITVSIFKNCTNNLRTLIGSYSYNRTGLPGFFGSTDTFSFFVCDCNTCQPDECCYYSAEITAASVVGTTATINGISLSAIIASSSDN